MEQKDAFYELRLGRTTFIVCIKQADTAEKSADTAFRDICMHECMGGWGATEPANLSQFSKSS